jgi:hypothetical protein
MAVDYQLTHTTHEKRLDLGSDIFQLLFSSEHAFQVPPFVNDIAAVLPWLLQSAQIPLSYCYQLVTVNLHFVCYSNGDYHIYHLDAHLRIAIICLNNVLRDFYPLKVWENGLDDVKGYMLIRWGNRIHYAGFQIILLDAYYFIQQHFGFGYLKFTNHC